KRAGGRQEQPIASSRLHGNSPLGSEEFPTLYFSISAILPVCTAAKRQARSVHLGAGSPDHRRQALLVGGAVGGGVGRTEPERRCALLEVGRLEVVALERLLGEPRQLLHHGRRQA